jgi:hypothetical protein
MLGSVALFGPVVVALWVFSVADVLATPRARVRRLPKRRWLVLTSFLPLVGSVAWLLAGRPVSGSRRTSGRRHCAAFTDDDIRALMIAMSPPEDPEDFRRRCGERAQEQRRRYADQQRAAGPANEANGVAE